MPLFNPTTSGYGTFTSTFSSQQPADHKYSYNGINSQGPWTILWDGALSLPLFQGKLPTLISAYVTFTYFGGAILGDFQESYLTGPFVTTNSTVVEGFSGDTIYGYFDNVHNPSSFNLHFIAPVGLGMTATQLAPFTFQQYGISFALVNGAGIFSMAGAILTGFWA